MDAVDQLSYSRIDQVGAPDLELATLTLIGFDEFSGWLPVPGSRIILNFVIELSGCFKADFAIVKPPVLTIMLLEGLTLGHPFLQCFLNVQSFSVVDCLELLVVFDRDIWWQVVSRKANGDV